MGVKPLTDKAFQSTKSRFKLGVLILAVLLGVMYWPTWQWMWERWNQEQGYFSHGMFVPVVTIILVLIKQGQLRKTPLGSARVGLYLIIGSVLAHLFAGLWGINFLSGLSLIPMILGLELYFLGPQVTHVLLWPTLFLFFMVPLPQVSVDYVATQSKFVAAKVSVWLMQLADYEVAGAGSRVFMPEGKQLVVDDICSGLKYLFSLVAFGAFYVQLCSLTPARKAILFALAFPLAWLANVIRILTLCLVGYHWGTEKAVQWYSHDLFGFVMYFVAFVLMFLAESGLMIGMKKPEDAEDKEKQDAEPAT